MQKPITPTRPVQPGCPVSQARTVSTSSKVRPARRRRSLMARRTQATGRPQENRSGAAVRKPSLASQSAWLRTSWPMPNASWMRTTPGHGCVLAGVARYTGRSPWPPGIVVSAIAVLLATG